MSSVDIAAQDTSPIFRLYSPTPSDLPILAAIQTNGFASSISRFSVFHNVSSHDYQDWVLRILRNPEPPEGTREEVRVARVESGEIVGWARWTIPNGDNDSKRVHLTRLRNTLPTGMDEAAWEAFWKQVHHLEYAVMDDSRYIDFNMLVVHSDHQGRGAGRALLRACTDSADSLGLPTFLFGSPRGKKLYESVGFVVKKVMLNDEGVVITSAMKREPLLSSLHTQ